MQIHLDNQAQNTTEQSLNLNVWSFPYKQKILLIALKEDLSLTDTGKLVQNADNGSSEIYDSLKTKQAQ